MLQPYAWALSQATQSPTEAAQNVRNVAPRRPRKDTCCQSDTRRPRPPVQPHLGTRVPEARHLTAPGASTSRHPRKH